MPKNRLFSIILPAVWIILLSGCSNTKLLTFFFDGVPRTLPISASDPLNLVRLEGKPDSLAQIPAQPKFNYHPPYQDKECASCHDQNIMGKLVQPMPGLCYQCHEDFAAQLKMLHGPVESGECISCHSPHLAANEKLTILPGQKLCYSCHDSPDILATEPHKAIGTSKCTTCHNPHGGNQQYFIK